MKKRTTIHLIAVVVLVVAVWQFLKQDNGVGVESVSWLPSEARNMTYLDQPLTNRMAEFEIEREAFERWCQKAAMPLRELGCREFHMILRCLPLLERQGIIPAVTEPNEVEAHACRSERVGKRLTEGDLYYSWHWSNGGAYTIR